jgi:hypothetical protein
VRTGHKRPTDAKAPATRSREEAGAQRLGTAERGPPASRAVGRRSPCENSGRGLKKNVIADRLRTGLEGLAPSLSCRHEIGPLHPRRIRDPRPICTCRSCDRFALPHSTGGTKQKAVVHRVNHLASRDRKRPDTRHAPSSSMSSNTGLVLMVRRWPSDAWTLARSIEAATSSLPRPFHMDVGKTPRHCQMSAGPTH